jgi:hypothetical protein
MVYRAIRWMNDGESYAIHHFTSIVDAYKWLVPTQDIQEKERWHVRLLWVVIEDFNGYENYIQMIGHNEPLNPEEFPVTRLYIQHVETIRFPLPLL